MFAMATPKIAPTTWALTYGMTSRQGIPPCQASDKVTAELKWPPQIGPKTQDKGDQRNPRRDRVRQ